MNETDETVWHVGTRYRGWRLDHFIKDKLPRLSRTYIQQIIRERIRVSWRTTAAPSTKVNVGGSVIAGYPRLFEIPESYSFEVLYEGHELLVINKPAGLVVHPTNGCRVNSVIEAVRRERNDPCLTLTHRLDRETSGVLVLAKSPSAATNVCQAFANHRFKKTYVARVKNRPQREQGTIREPLGKHPTSRIHIKRAAVKEGEKAVTRYRVMAHEKDTTLLLLQPETGRRHQLRVHCESLGCPIIGEPLYGYDDNHYIDYVNGTNSRERIHLHAWRLEGEIMSNWFSFEASLPDFLSPLDSSTRLPSAQTIS